MKKAFLLLAIFTLSIYSCEKDSGPYIVNPPTTAVPVLVSYINEIQPIFNDYCISCHDEFHPSLNLKTCCSWDQLMNTGASSPYVDTITPSNSLLYQRITGTIPPQMPLGTPLSTSDMELILKWIEEGARNN